MRTKQRKGRAMDEKKSNDVALSAVPNEEVLNISVRREVIQVEVTVGVWTCSDQGNGCGAKGGIRGDQNPTQLDRLFVEHGALMGQCSACGVAVKLTESSLVSLGDRGLGSG